MIYDLDKVLIPQDEIAERVVTLGGEITRDLESLSPDADIVIIAILTGSIIFVADLIRQLPQKLRINLVGVTSYPGKSKTSQGPGFTSEINESLKGKHVLIIDDILDSGKTLSLIIKAIVELKPASIKTCVLLSKKDKPDQVIVECDYVGFEIPNEFVVGYGLDFDGYYRNLPHIATLKDVAM